VVQPNKISRLEVFQPNSVACYPYVARSGAKSIVELEKSMFRSKGSEAAEAASEEKVWLFTMPDDSRLSDGSGDW
jgi:hypothetical protein